MTEIWPLAQVNVLHFHALEPHGPLGPLVHYEQHSAPNQVGVGFTAICRHQYLNRHTSGPLSQP
jgi:hypothetical protein